VIGAIAIAILCAGCGVEQRSSDEPYEWSLPLGLEPPRDPANNPTTKLKVELGRRLFFDVRLSRDESYSCATCHDPHLAFTDGLAVSRGIYGDALPRGALSLANVGYLRFYTWSNDQLTTLEEQALVPMLAKRPAELDIADHTEAVLDRFRADSELSALFEGAFAREEDPFQLGHVARALAAFERTLVFAGSAYDRFLAGFEDALSGPASRGRALFFSARLGCGGCHSGRWLTDADSGDAPFHNTGLYDLDGRGAYPYDNRGLIELTGRAADMGRFRTPSLRNVTRTAPYMHDGSIETLRDVLRHYEAGGRAASNAYKDPLITGFMLDDAEREDLLAFFESLTDGVDP
jgi:cytochrome c peroxidase